MSVKDKNPPILCSQCTWSYCNHSVNFIFEGLIRCLIDCLFISSHLIFNSLDGVHVGQVESLRAQLSEEHSRGMEKLRREMAALQEEEKEREEQELEAARKRQIAIDDLDRGVGAIDDLDSGVGGCMPLVVWAVGGCH